MKRQETSLRIMITFILNTTCLNHLVEFSLTVAKALLFRFVHSVHQPQCRITRNWCNVYSVPGAAYHLLVKIRENSSGIRCTRRREWPLRWVFEFYSVRARVM